MKTTEKKSGGLRSAYALKKGAVATAVTAVFIACVILLNVLVTVLANKLPLTLDVTAAKFHSISRTNADYIKAIDKDVDIYMYSSKKDYAEGYMTDYALQYYSAQDPTGRYYEQTVKLLEEYARYNPRLHIRFVDASAADSTELKTQFADLSFGYGDLLLESTFEVNGQPVTRQDAVRFNEIYTLSDPTGYASAGYSPYTISANNLETALTSAIYNVTSERSIRLGLPADYCNADTAQGLLATLKNYNYEIVEITGPTLTNIAADLDALLLYELKTDLTADETAAIEQFLDNGGKKGKTLLYFASAESPALPNVEALLKNWGIAYGQGLLFETTENFVETQSNLYSFNARSDYTAAINGENNYYISDANRPMEALELDDESKTVTTLLQTGETVAVKTADGAMGKPQAYPTALACEQTGADTKTASHVLAFSSVNLITTAYNNYQNVGNIALIAESLNFTVGREATNVDITAKTVDSYAFTSPASNQNSIFVILIFVFLIPIGILVFGIILFIKRKNR